MRVSILCENQAKRGYRDKMFQAQHGLSIFVEARKEILFDTGPTGAFLHNAALLGISVADADLVVLSHGHWDHTGGLIEFPTEGRNKTLLAHPDVFADRYKVTGEYVGPSLSREEVVKKFDLSLSKQPYQITGDIYFLGEIPRLNGFEAKKSAFYYTKEGERFPDFIMDDTALAIKTGKGLVIITGCSHSGICNIVEYAKRVAGQDLIYAVIGGFHLLGNEAQLQGTVDYFLENRAEHLYPMHCTDLSSLSRFYETFGIKKLCTGDTIDL